MICMDGRAHTYVEMCVMNRATTFSRLLSPKYIQYELIKPSKKKIDLNSDTGRRPAMGKPLNMDVS